MANLTIDDALAQRLQEIATEEKRTVNDVLRSLLVAYDAQAAKADPLKDFLDVFSGKDLDLSKSIKETSEIHYRKKYGDSD